MLATYAREDDKSPVMQDRAAITHLSLLTPFSLGMNRYISVARNGRQGSPYTHTYIVLVASAIFARGGFTFKLHFNLSYLFRVLCLPVHL